MLKAVNALILRDFQLEEREMPNSEEALLDWLADYVAYCIEKKMEYLMSLMYRMDISEEAVHFALSPLNQEPANLSIAKLILNRQKDRVHTKAFYQQEDLDVEEGLEW